MKRTSSDLAKWAETIGRKNFLKLSSKRRHELLAALALETIPGGDYRHFRRVYDRLLSWADLDGYTPPSWLSEKEALHQFFAFHGGFGANRFADGRGAEASGVAWRCTFDVTVMLDQVRSPYNIGSILRIIDNFGLRGVVHGDSHIRLDHPRLHKAARGCENWIPVKYEADPLRWLETAEAPVIGIEEAEEATPVGEWRPPPSCILVVGNEEYGIAKAIRKRCSHLVRIPMHGYKKSMNVHHALAIIAHKITETLKIESRDC